MKLAALVLTAACSARAPSDCERAVHHVTSELIVPAGAPPPPAEEAEVIRMAEAMSVAACEREGLSAAQRDCILAARTPEDFRAVFKCPAIAERRPSWLLGQP